MGENIREMKILHVLNSPRAEGTPRLVLDWLQEKSLDQHIYFLQNKPYDLIEEFKNKTYNLTFSDTVFHNNALLRLLFLPIQIYRHCKMVKPDILISWNQGYGYLIVFGAKLAGINTLIIHAGCAPEYHPKWGKYYFLLSSFFIKKTGATIVCASNHIANTYRTLPFIANCKFKVVYNCMDLAKFICNTQTIRKKQAIYVANLEITKDHISLINAWKIVTSELKNVSLLCVGRGELQEQLENYVKKLGLQTSIIFTGYRIDIPQLLKESEIFVFTSTDKEGFGTVLLEALAAGLKVISFAEPAPIEVLKNGKYGILIEKRNVDELAKSIIETFKNPITTKEIEQNIEYTRLFSIKNMIDNYISIGAK
jgi:glycosyltransferase involved in cell wall biosynthesis